MTIQTIQTIYFDMDGTIVDLYGYEGWLSELRRQSCKPYERAAPLLKLQPLARKLNELQTKGIKLGIITWLSKTSTTEYDSAVTQAKMKWLKTHLKSVEWDEIHIVPYGTPKHELASDPMGILFDDEIKNRTEWKGEAFCEKDIMDVLKAIAQAIVFLQFSQTSNV